MQFRKPVVCTVRLLRGTPNRQYVLTEKREVEGRANVIKECILHGLYTVGHNIGLHSNRYTATDLRLL